MIDTLQLRNFIIIPTLKYLDLYSESAVNLLLGTCAQESEMGRYLHQINGPAQGIFQMEPATEKLVWQYLNKYPLLSGKVQDLIPAICASAYDIHDMEGNLYYACAMARVLYRSIAEQLPEKNDINGLATYWKQYYNTPKGKGAINQFKANYAKYVSPFL